MKNIIASMVLLIFAPLAHAIRTDGGGGGSSGSDSTKLTKTGDTATGVIKFNAGAEFGIPASTVNATGNLAMANGSTITISGGGAVIISTGRLVIDGTQTLPAHSGLIDIAVMGKSGIMLANNTSINFKNDTGVVEGKFYVSAADTLFLEYPPLGGFQFIDFTSGIQDFKITNAHDLVLGAGNKSGDAKITLNGGVAALSTMTVAGNAFSVGGSTFVVLASSVGIGTSSPGSKLHLSSGTLVIDGTGTNSILASGRVGIGITNPGFALVVNGEIQVNGSQAGNIFNFSKATGPGYFWAGAGTYWGCFGAAANDRTSIGWCSSKDNTQALSVTNISLLDTGFTGFGAATPGTKLHVSSGVLTIDGNTSGLVLSSGATTGSTYVLHKATTQVLNPGTVSALTVVRSSATCLGAKMTQGSTPISFCSVSENNNGSVTGVVQTCTISGPDTCAILTACVNGAAGTCATTSQTYVIDFWTVSSF